MRATRRTYLAFWSALLVATVASGWLVSLALALRRQEAEAVDIVLGVIGVPLLVPGLLVISRILYHTYRPNREEA